jgi:glutamate racemase
MGGRLDGIAVFDSGMGGLDVAAAISRALPSEDIIYLGDNARVPYGTKSASVVQQYTMEAAHWLKAKGIKALVIACNTASAVMDQAKLESELSVPVLGMIEAGVSAVQTGPILFEPPKRLVVLATPGTIRSQAYQVALKTQYPQVEITSVPCPLFVPLVEMGWERHPLTPKMVEAQLMEHRRLLEPVINRPGDEEVIYLLGCTHYPMMSQSISEGISLVDSAPFRCIDGAESAASMLRQILGERGLLRVNFTDDDSSSQQRHEISETRDLGARYAYFSDEPSHQAAIELALRFWQNRGGVGELSIQGMLKGV